MSETSRKLQAISTTEIVQEFRRALVSLYPSLEKLDLMAEGSGYDESEEIEEKLWDILVVQSLKWRHGLDSAPNLPQYGLVRDESVDSAIYVYLVDGRSGRFVRKVNPMLSQQLLLSLRSRDGLFAALRLQFRPESGR